MKRLLIILLIIASGAVISCSDDPVDNTPTTLEIEFTPGWDTARGITRSSQTVTVSVKLNVESVNWRVGSDSEWCIVDSEEIHTGSGTFEIAVTANEDFDKRFATVSITAGAHTRELQVDQTGNVFIMNNVYSVFPAAADHTFDIEVASRDEWEIGDGEWIHAEKIDTSEPDESGMTTTRLRIRCDANSEAAGRYGTFELIPENGYALEYPVFQFGTQIPVDEAGKFEVDGTGGASFVVVAPAEIVTGIVVPKWIEYSSEQDEQQHTVYTFTVGKCVSDTQSGREATVALQIKDCTDAVELPAISQGFVPAGGIVTGEGLRAFARACNAGESVADWQSDMQGETVVSVLSDIDMSQITEWEPIGTANLPYSGRFVGNGHRIEGWKSTAPLFGVVGSGAEINGLTMAEDCLFSFTGTVSSNSYFGPFAGRLSGKLIDCINLAPVTVDKIATTSIMGFGGIAGRLDGGVIEHCTNEAALTVTDAVTTTKHLYVGGIAGIGGDVADRIAGCSNKGVLNVAASQSERSLNPGIYLGGIVGSEAGAIANCTTADRGMEVRSDAAYILYCGGIAGYTTGSVTECTNAQPITTRLVRNADNCRYEYTGGIVGRSKGSSMQNCQNRGQLTSASSQKIVYIGGVAGWMESGSATGNTNSGKIDIQGDAASSFAGNRNIYAGGLIGVAQTALTIQGTGAADNSGAISIGAIENYTTATIYAGGIVAWFNAEGSVSNLRNTGGIAIPMQSKPLCYAVGGIAGVSNATIAQAVNEGKITAAHDVNTTEASAVYLGGIVGWNEKTENLNITDCENKAEVSITSASKTCSQLYNTYVGGILGYSAVAVTVEKCTNSGYTARNGANAGVNEIRGAVGGIAGAIDGAAAIIADCHMKADVRNYHYNNTIDIKEGTAGGGIVGIALGVGAASGIHIRGCTSAAFVEGKRGHAGGIAGYIRYGSIQNSRFTGQIIGSGPSYSGGIAGCADAATIDACTVKSEKIYAHSPNYGCGAFAGWLKAGSSVSGSKGFATLTQAAAAKANAGLAAGMTEAGTSISTCGVGGSVRGTELTTANFGAWVAGDANASVSGCYYWNGTEN